MKLLILSVLFSVAVGQELISLKSLKGGNVNNDLKYTAPYGVFVSAHSDNQAALSSIFVVLKDGTKMSLDTLRVWKASETSGQLLPYIVSDSAYITTTLTTNQLAALNGVVFLSSTDQINNKNFFVYDISHVNQIVDLQRLTDDSVHLFLNTHMGTNPYKSTVISQWKQDPNSFSYIYFGVPSDIKEANNTQIFSNPIHSDKFDAFFSNVERFSLASTMAFYLKTRKGGPSFRIDPGYFTIDGTTTTSPTTTGFFMKPLGGAETTTTVHIKRDTKYSGYCGANTVGTLQTGGRVSVSANDGQNKYDMDEAPNPFFIPWSIPYVAENFRISSTNGKTGEYFVQYFAQQGPLKTGTTSKPGIQTTTTKSSGTVPTISFGTRPTMSPTRATKSSGNTVNTVQPPIPTVPGHVQTTTKSSATNRVLVIVSAIIAFIAFI